MCGLAEVDRPRMLPPKANRKRVPVHQHVLAGVEVLPLVLACLAGLYLLKTAAGINVFPDMHLSELFDF